MREWRADLVRGERNVPIVPAAAAGIRKHMDDIGRTRVVSYRLVGKAAGEGDTRFDSDTVNRLAPRSPEMQVAPHHHHQRQVSATGSTRTLSLRQRTEAIMRGGSRLPKSPSIRSALGRGDRSPLPNYSMIRLAKHLWRPNFRPSRCLFCPGPELGLHGSR